jgi:hypothetical protein
MKAFLAIFTILIVLFTQSGFSYDEKPSTRLVPEGAILFNDGGGHVYLVYSQDGSRVTIYDTTGAKLSEVENKALPSIAKAISKLFTLEEVIQALQDRAEKVEKSNAPCPSGYYRDPSVLDCKVKFQR